MKRTIRYLTDKMLYHEDKANDYFNQIKVLEDKQRLIGFRPKNDNRMSTDGVQISVSNITTIQRY